MFNEKVKALQDKRNKQLKLKEASEEKVKLELEKKE